MLHHDKQQKEVLTLSGFSRMIRLITAHKWNIPQSPSHY